ncbi:hypothetical protein I4U23_003625 [Adineta vaga]|nr:hypothetical protein I4U23_003625 [Adineta vaga]
MVQLIRIYRTVLSDTTAALAMIQLFLRYNWTSCIMIYQNDAFVINGAKVISDTLTRNGSVIQHSIIFDIVSQKIQGDLKQILLSSTTRIVVLWASESSTSLIIENALTLNVLGPRFTWILSSRFPLTSFNQTYYQNLVGMLTVEPVPGILVNAPLNTTLLNAAYELWKEYEPETFPGSTKVNTYALFSFDATWALIQSLEKYCSNMENNSSSCVAFTGSSYCFHRRFINSKLLLNTMNSIGFLGISGPIQFNTNVTDRTNGSYYYA